MLPIVSPLAIPKPITKDGFTGRLTFSNIYSFIPEVRERQADCF
jgi:hypothetical protein